MTFDGMRLSGPADADGIVKSFRMRAAFLHSSARLFGRGLFSGTT